MANKQMKDALMEWVKSEKVLAWSIGYVNDQIGHYLNKTKDQAGADEAWKIYQEKINE
tara:strand:- start:199 stop:372 length:174 start_codon:yes stop_codon:yes gene_type:complete